MHDHEVDPPADHEKYMRRCIDSALIAKDRGNTPVGSVVVLGGEVIGEGIEALPSETNLTGHAEVLACQDAVDRTGNAVLHNATLYTTAEPCFMCAYVIRQCGIALVVYGVETPMIGSVTSPHSVLIDRTLDASKRAPTVVGGILVSCEL